MRNPPRRICRGPGTAQLGKCAHHSPIISGQAHRQVAPGNQLVEVASQQVPAKKLVQPTCLSAAPAADGAGPISRARHRRAPVATPDYNAWI